MFLNSVKVALYWINSSYAENNGRLFLVFKWERGVRQGYTHSTILYIIALTPLHQSIQAGKVFKIIPIQRWKTMPMINSV